MKKVQIVINFIVIFFVICYLAYIRLTNMDMTDIRLFVTYWKEFISCMVILAICGLLIKDELD